MTAPPGWERRSRQFTLPSVAGQIGDRPAMFRFRRGRSYHVNTTVHYDRRQVSKPGVVSVAALMNLAPATRQTGRSDHTRRLVRGW